MQLVIETSSFFSSVALFSKSECIAFAEAKVQNSHSEGLHSLIEDVLNNEKIQISSLKTLVMGGGPGSNTGLRIGLAALKGFATIINKIPLALDSHAAMAFSLNGLIGDSLLITTSKRGLYNFTHFKNDMISGRGNTKAPKELSAYMGQKTMVACPDGFSIDELSEFNPVQLLPDARILGNYFNKSQNNLEVDLSTMY